IKKFFISLVSQARSVYFHAHQEAETWLREVMNPLIAQIKEHRNMMERRLKTLRKINESRDTLDSKLI
ncbi:MAG: dynamin family protein, partial [Gammaproteobacteria bacterium]